MRYNLSHLEQWCRDQKLQDVGVTKPLEPVIQASQLLQARKTEDDVVSICEMCDKLSYVQVSYAVFLPQPHPQWLTVCLYLTVMLFECLIDN